MKQSAGSLHRRANDLHSSESSPVLIRLVPVNPRGLERVGLCAGRTGPQGIQPSPVNGSLGRTHRCRPVQAPVAFGTQPAAKVVTGKTKEREREMANTPNKRPSHAAYMVEGEGDNATWTEIGALWAHEDGQGFNLSLKALPVSGRIVIRQRKAKDTQAKESAGR